MRRKKESGVSVRRFAHWSNNQKGGITKETESQGIPSVSTEVEGGAITDLTTNITGTKFLEKGMNWTIHNGKGGGDTTVGNVLRIGKGPANPRGENRGPQDQSPAGGSPRGGVGGDAAVS